MDYTEIIKKAGLNESQAKVYNALLVGGEMAPTEIAEKTKETREYCYLVAKKLEEMGLIEQIKTKKITYRVLNPSNLELLAEKRRKIIQKNEKTVKDSMSELLDTFYANNEMPGSRTLEGIEGVKEVYRDVLRVKKDVYLLRTTADEQLSGERGGDFLEKYRKKLPILGIKTYALTPITPIGLYHEQSGEDKRIGFFRTWMPLKDYDAPVAVQVYGDKVAFIAFGEKPMATITTSLIIAEGVRQMIKIMIRFYAEREDEIKKEAKL